MGFPSKLLICYTYSLLLCYTIVEKEVGMREKSRESESRNSRYVHCVYHTLSKVNYTPLRKK